MNAVLSVRDAVKSFGAAMALKGATFELREGEWLALLGPNGAGKTTLVRSVAGRVRLDSGAITLLGRPLSGSGAEAADVRSKLGIVPQEIALYPRLTAMENLRCFGEILGLRGRTLTERIDWALESAGLKDRAGDIVESFSGGMKRRLNIVCGVLHRPPVVLLDEPTVGVDPQSRQRIWEMLDALKRDGASLLLTTHQLDEAQQICDRIVVIDHGKAIAQGTFNELVAQTIGAKRHVSLMLAGGDPVVCGLDEFVDDGPAILARVKAGGHRVVDVRIDSPTLQAVFIHLTGRDLRE